MTIKPKPLRRTSRRCALLLFLGLPFTSGACGTDSESPATPDANAPSIDASDVDTWESYASGFFQAYCHECHGPGDSLRDYSLLETVQSEESKIRCGVSSESIAGCSIPARQFPIGSGATPSDEERARLVLWIEDGAN